MSLSPPSLPNDAITVARRTRDFPGRLSPMLVKELRQGMRSNLFVVAFILLQGLMIFGMLTGLADPDSPVIDGFFWFFIFVTLLIVQPLRGFNALSSEYLLNTMDLIQLTRLDAWRITLGKWTALNAQTFLFVTGVLPYMVMRYFLGNVNFVTDLSALFFLSLGSAFASAITVGCSAFRSFILRSTLVLTFAVGMSVLYGIVGAAIMSSGAALGNNLFELLLATLALVYGCFFFLSFGASRIAPPSENHSTRKRLYAVGFALTALAFLVFAKQQSALAVIILILALSSIDALTEPLPIYARVLEPFRGNFLLRLSALVFAPGWISGLGYFLLCTAFWFLLIIQGDIFGTLNITNQLSQATFLLSSANLIIFPLFFLHLFSPKQSSNSFTFGAYCFIQFCLLAFTTMVGMASQIALSKYENFVTAIFPIPSVLLLSIERDNMPLHYHLIFLGFAALTFFLSLLIPLLRQREAVREFGKFLKPR